MLTKFYRYTVSLIFIFYPSLSSPIACPIIYDSNSPVLSEFKSAISPHIYTLIPSFLIMYKYFLLSKLVN